MMKMVMITYNEAMDSEVMETLDRCSLENYTKFSDVFGKGSSSGTHLGDDTWPGKNNALFVACPDKKADEIVSRVKELRRTLGKEGIKAFVWDLASVT